ncbi:MAG: DUF255 domain-containing protein [Rickettsiales bacterium]|nr:DUF255 domain-containing protein [Rickettsiales bacterium]
MIIDLNKKLSLNSDGAAPNHLINSTSPYLLQHAYNPVNWYPWGEEAFAKARKENKPILLSIGYSTCYWCHVMEREVFEDPEVARLMNDTMINIKIDREERPDLDDIYMSATQIITKSGGWPNNVFVTPDLKPFFATTYLPPEMFTPLIKNIYEGWTTEQESIERQANKLSQFVISTKEHKVNSQALRMPDRKVVNNTIDHLKKYYDQSFGGFYTEPKFPYEASLLFLLSSSQLLDNQMALDMAQTSLNYMASGGINDHVGGGFHRYSTDNQWHIPHFEKMLYNQALLARAYTELYSISGSALDLDVATNIFAYVLRDMQNSKGGFYSALDAETDRVEGAYYVWSNEELALLDPLELSWLKQHYDFANIPDLPGHESTNDRVLYLKESKSLDLKQKNKVMSSLLKIRSKRKTPHLDDKIITSWNGLMIDSLARAGITLNNPKYVNAAKKSADFILDNLVDRSGNLLRSWRNGKAHTQGFFEDYSFLIQGLISTYKASKEQKYLDSAIELTVKANSLFLDSENGGYFFTDGLETLLVRAKDSADSAIPSANAVMAHCLLDLYEITGDVKYQVQFENILQAFATMIEKSPGSYTYMVYSLMRYQTNPTIIPNIPIGLKTKEHVLVAAEIDPYNRDLDITKLIIKLTIEPGWHINANPASLDLLIPTTVQILDYQSNIQYPTPVDYSTPLGNIKVYQDNITILAEISPAIKTDNFKVRVRSQACKDSTCLLPSDWVLDIANVGAGSSWPH